ncbi:hypothetical protein KBB96_20805 [Luteolibacter ambystomatis]|uniref:Uncharacterized protein n=1 Tax=Luteolibacter ambystomatis TaxID=2824561 RepID=A0A975G8H1_9BACT|nr:hypothetical protein [Luteolibacter ambystomatis]QUE51282.1 hypothetical protein KBB96_20805 [Luteolibacter ambystomatis]
MNDSEKIVCKPTPWFLLRALVMLAMFGVFAVLFYRDGNIGYRRQNATYYLREAFIKADQEFKAKGESLTPADWRKYAEQQPVEFIWKGKGQDGSVLPPEVQPGMKWPEPLRDAEAMKANPQWQRRWEEFSAKWPAWKMDSIPPHEPFEAGKIREQWIVFGICAALAALAAYFLLRTIGRSIVVDGEALYVPGGKRIPFADLKRLDLRKWETKGLAFADYSGSAGSGRVRIDGLTYGGFKKEQGEPAEQLMKHLRARFSGEVIEYAPVSSGEVDSPAGTD